MQQLSRGFDASNDQELQVQRFSQSFSRQNKNEQQESFSYPSEQLTNSIKQQLYQANQILPAHKTISKDKQKVSFKLNSLTFYKQCLTERPNRSSFPSISSNSNQISQQFNGNQPLLKLKQEMGEFSVFLNDKKALIYQRIKNEVVNYLCKNEKGKSSFSKNQMKYFCSLFVNSKLQKNKSLNQPIWEHVNDTYDLTLPQVSSDVLQFQSSFQSGNLFAVFKDASHVLPTYELYLQNDVNTKGSTQWFYFRVTSKARIKVKFKIMNFYKSTSLYQEGMKILVRSQSQEWKRVGTAIKYAKNPIQGTKDSYFLEFLHEFESTIKPVYFSYCYPYTFTKDLCCFTELLEDKHYKKKIFKKQLLCKSNMGNELFMFSISNNVLGSAKTPSKPIIYIIGRQHSGETPSSFVLEGMINFLLSSRIQANELRQNFEFRIIPMVNVDGVISGNYRSNISGNDVNRQWLFPSKALHPQIYHIKQEILSNKRNTQFFLDIHAHSRKMNSFFYGCSDQTKQNKLYPFFCSKLSKFISYGNSSFCDDPSKSTTARVVIQKELNIVNSLTFEISFYGWTDSKKIKHHFSQADLEDIGVSLGLGLYYSQISLKKIQRQKSQTKTQLKSNKSSQKEKIILKNTLKIYEKWKLQLEKQLKIQNDQISEGSSIDPDQWTLQKEQILSIELQNEKFVGQLGSIKVTKNHQTNFFQTSDNKVNLKNRSIKSSRRYEKLLNDRDHKKKKKLSGHCLKIEEQQEEEKNVKSNLFTYSINEPFLKSSKNFTVKQLQRELQGKRQHLSSISESQNLTKSPRGTIDFKSTLRYHDKIREMKNNFSYCLKQSQNGLIEHYENTNSYGRFIPSLDGKNQVKRDSSLKSRAKKDQFFALNTKRGLSFNEKRGNSFFKSRKQSDFKLQKV